MSATGKLHDVSCDNCEYEVKGECRRFPPVVWTETNPNGLLMTQFAFPPAINRCGEYR